MKIDLRSLKNNQETRVILTNSQETKEILPRETLNLTKIENFKIKGNPTKSSYLDQNRMKSKRQSSWTMNWKSTLKKMVNLKADTYN
jgi:hypothetical protein